MIDPLLPNKPRGIPRVDDRRVLNGIFWVLRLGAPWRDLPERYGPYTTCYNRFNRWRKAGVWDRIMDAVSEAYDGDTQMIDSSVVRVHQHAANGAGMLLTDLPDGGVLLGDKAYDVDWIRERIEAQGAAPNIPDKANRKQRHCFSKALHKERNHVERFFNWIKHFCRIAMRFQKLAANYLAMIKLASIRVWLRIQTSGVGCPDQGLLSEQEQSR